MSSVKTPKFWRLLAFRLTLWYGGLLAASALFCFLISYYVIVMAMRDRTDADLLREAAGCADALHAGGLPGLRTQMEDHARATGTNDIFFLVYDRAGQPIASSDVSTWADMTLPPLDASAANLARGPQFLEANGIGHHQRLRVLTAAMDDGNVLRIGTTIQDDVRVIEQARRVASLILVCLLGIAVVVGWLLAKRALAGVQKVTNTANEISHGSLGRRVAISGSGDEIDQLAQTVNRMLERIEVLVQGMKETNDNIAHELRSPIARIRGLAEMTLTGQPSENGYEEMAASTVEECDQILSMINTMLDIAEAEAGVMNLKMAPIDVAELLRKLCELYEPVTSAKDIHLVLEIPDSPTVEGDLQKLQRVLANLLDNAVKYTPHGGTIKISSRLFGRNVQIRVSNSGDGISAEDLPNIFKRFYRGDKSRSEPGNGLGLSLARAIMRSHGGDITVQSIPGADTVFTLSLPTEEHIPLAV